MTRAEKRVLQSLVACRTAALGGHYGILANRHRQEKLALCRRLLHAASREAAPAPTTPVLGTLLDGLPADSSAPICPVCRTGHMVISEHRPRPTLALLMRKCFWDSS